MTARGKVREADGQPVDEAQRTAMVEEVRRLRALLAGEAIGMHSRTCGGSEPLDGKVNIAARLVERMLFQDVAGLQAILDGLVQS